MFGVATPGIPSFGDLAWHKPVTDVAYAALSAATLSPAAGVSFGQTLTKASNGPLSAEPIASGGGVTVGDRLLVTSEASPRNGIWIVTSLGSAGSPWVLTRATDMDSLAEGPVGSITYDLTLGGLWVAVGGGAGAWTLSPNQVGSLFMGLLAAGPDLQLRRSAAATLELSNAAGGAAILDILAGGIIAHGTGPIVQAYAPGAATWTKPAGIHHIVVECWGGGGAGGGVALTGASQFAAAGGGAGGAYARKLFSAADLAGAASFSVAVGAGGAPGTAGANPGNPGNDTTFSGTGITSVVGKGGSGGSGSVAFANTTVSSLGAGGAAVAATGGDLNATGSDGQSGMVAGTSTGQRFGGYGGAAGGPGGGATAINTTVGGAAGATGSTPGGGGSGAQNGASVAAKAGGAGGPGRMIVTEYYAP